MKSLLRLYAIFLAYFLHAPVWCASTQPADPRITIHCTNQEHQYDTAMLYAHGIMATQNQGIKHFARVTERGVNGTLYTNKYWIFDEPMIVFDFPDALPNGQFNKLFVNLGQQFDQFRLDHVYQQTLQQLPTCTKIIGSGISRGAATWLNYAAEYRPKNLSALVLESPFDSIKSIVNQLLKKFHVSWLPFSGSVSLWAAKKKFPSLNINGPFPIDVVDQIEKELPILLVHSRSDGVVPTNSSRNLYIKLRQSGHNNVYLFELARGEHGKLMQGMEAELYQNCVHAFFAKYNLPHNPDFAQRGVSLLATAQPSIEEVQRWIKSKRSIATLGELELPEGEFFTVDDEHGIIDFVIQDVQASNVSNS